MSTDESIPEQADARAPAVDVMPTEEHDRAAQPVDSEEPPRLPFPVVAIGASAGGLEAFGEFFNAMPADSGMAFILIQHLPPDRESMIAEILSKRTTMPVAQVQDGMPVQPNHVYVIRPGHTLTIKDGVLHLGKRVETPGHSRPVDDFFKSLAEEQRERAIAIIMSGMGSNGAAGAQAIKAVGGMCIAQDPDSAQFPSMPRHLIDAGYADYILRPPDMPEVLLQYAHHPYTRGGRQENAASRHEEQHLREIIAILRARTRHDFSGYKKATIQRRIQRRMGLNHITPLSEYTKLMRESPVESSALLDDLLIHVTGFFRDAEAWESLRSKVIVPLIAARQPGESLRCWVTACSSGEEAYTLGMLLIEEAERVNKFLDIKIFATDTAQRTLANARQGIYPGGLEADITPERLERFFHKEDEVYRVRQDLRELVIFAPQNVLQDPPFFKLDIATCRNLLIYLEPEMQQRVLSLLHFGLRDGGALFLGTSETASIDGLFETLDKKARIFRRIGKPQNGPLTLLPRTPVGLREKVLAEHVDPIPRSVAQLTRRTLLAHHVPAAVTVDRDFRIVYFQGNTHPYFSQPTGEPTRDLMAVIRDSVRGAVRTALQRAVKENGTAIVMDGWILTEQGRRKVVVTASPLEASAHPPLYVVSFKEQADLALTPVQGHAPADPRALDEELQHMREELQSTIEELQTSNEEQKASNEEITCINEELQSTNEELETSKEELQSLNEELTTVNSQLLAKIEEHQASSNDLNSLLVSTDIAVVFLDRRLRIRRYTPAMKSLMELISTDVGRPLRDLSWKFSDPELLADVQAVLDTLVPIEREIRAEGDRWYIRRVLPYRTPEDRIDGVVMTFMDISERKRTAAALAERARLLDLSNDAIIVRDVHNRVIYWNHGAAELYGWTPKEAIGKDLQELVHTDADIPHEQLIAELQKHDRLEREVVQVARDGRRITALCRWALDRDADGKPGAILTTATDMTAHKLAGEKARANEEHFRLLMDSVRDFGIFLLDPHGRISAWNAAAERLLGWTEKEALGQSGSLIFTPEDRAAAIPEKELAHARAHGAATDERWHLRKDGSRFWASGVMSAIRPGGVLLGFVKVLRDETVRKQTEDMLQAAKTAAEDANRIKDEFLATLSHEIRTPLSAILLWVKMLKERADDPAQLREGLAAIESSAEAQARLIEDMLDTSRIALGKLRMELAETELAPFVRAAVETIEPTAVAKSITLELTCPHDGAMVLLDENRMRQVLWNVLTNAVKFTPSGGTVSVVVATLDAEVEIRVIDSGQGISREFLPHIFDRFRQFESSTTRRYGGLGLGLTISKQLVELHGGTIEAASGGPGTGTTVTIRLPLLKNRAARIRRLSEKSESEETTLAGIRVLLVEDNPQTRQAMSVMLRRAGAELMTADSGAVALDAIAQSRPDLLVSDIGLPDLDGYTLIRTIRAQEAQRDIAPVPAVALSAYAREEDRQKALEAGFQQHVGKPIEPRRLISALRGLLNESPIDGD